MGVGHHRWGKGHVAEGAALVLINHISTTSLPGEKKKITLERSPSPKMSLFPCPSVADETDHGLSYGNVQLLLCNLFVLHDKRQNLTQFLTSPHIDFAAAAARHWGYRTNVQIGITRRKRSPQLGENILCLAPWGKQPLIAPIMLIKIGKISEFGWPELFSRNYHLTFSSAFDQF